MKSSTDRLLSWADAGAAQWTHAAIATITGSKDRTRRNSHCHKAMISEIQRDLFIQPLFAFAKAILVNLARVAALNAPKTSSQDTSPLGLMTTGSSTL